MTKGACELVRRGADGADGAVAFDLSRLFDISAGADLTVGRRVGCAVRLVDGTSRISRQHATLSWQQLDNGRSALSITGHGAHGTFVDGDKLQIGRPQQLKDGAAISFTDGPIITSAPDRGQPNEFTFVLRNLTALNDGSEQSSMTAVNTDAATMPHTPTPSEQDVQSPARQVVKRTTATADTAKSTPATLPPPRPRRSAGAAGTAAAAVAGELARAAAQVSAAAAAAAAPTALAAAPAQPGSAAEAPAARPVAAARKSRGGRGAETGRPGAVGKPQAGAKSRTSNDDPVVAVTRTPAAAGLKPVAEASKRKQPTRGRLIAAAAATAKDEASPSDARSGRKTARARKSKDARPPPQPTDAKVTRAGEAAKRKRPAGGGSGGGGGGSGDSNTKSSEKTKRVKQEPLPPVDIPEAIAGQEMVWPRGREPWRVCGLPVHEELDLEPTKVAAIKNCSQCFYEHFRKARESEAARCLNEDGTVKKREPDEKKKSQRPDLVAASIMAKEGRRLATAKVVGHFPGLNISDSFYSRAEMSVLGLHQPPVAGIDYMASDKNILAASRGIRFAVSIIVAGCYKDDTDDGHELWYTGQGGNDLLGNKAQFKDQELSLGNLALVGNMRLGVPVRVTRVQKDTSSIYGRAFIYDGLYDVIKYVNESGKDNKFVFRYLLRRRPNQGQLITERVKFGAFSSSKEKHALSCPGIIDTDISGGLEATVARGCQIPACNEIDDIPPPCSDLARTPTQEQCRGVAAHNVLLDWEPSCRYIVEMELPAGVPWPAPPVEPARFRGSKNPHAWIQHLNGGKLPYMGNGGRKPQILVKCRRLVYECGPWNTRCPDGSKCDQRATQQGIRFRLQLVNARGTGWGVISWDMIPAGAFVMIYYGKVITYAESEEVEDDSYLMDLGPRTDFDAAGTQLPEGVWDTSYTPKWTVDANPAGGVGRFVNHSCAPNLFVQPVLSRHHDQDLTYQAFFAKANIPPGTPLTFDYGHQYTDVNLKGKCCCGAPDCRQPMPAEEDRAEEVEEEGEEEA